MAKTAQDGPRLRHDAANALGCGLAAVFDKESERADGVKSGLAAWLASERIISRRTADRSASGIIHADLFPDNVFFTGAKSRG